MNQSTKSSKVAAGIAIILFLGTVTWGALNARTNSALESENNDQKLRNEALLSEKLVVEKNLAITESQLEDLASNNETLSRQIEEMRNLANLNEASIKQLNAQLAANKKKYDGLAATNHETEVRLGTLNQQIAALQSERLTADQEAEKLRGNIADLRKELAMARSVYYDKVLVESSRGKKDKLVVKASRAKKLKATVMIPSELKDVKFQIFDPSGKLISSTPDLGVVAVRITDDDNTLASTSGVTAKTYKQAEMTFLPKRKLAAGTYRIEVTSESLPIGSMHIRLR